MLYVERSNRTERLLDGLAHRLMAVGRDPLAPGVVVVQGPGMERWLAQSIARDYGICANTRFPFPQQFLDSLFAALPEEEGGLPSANPGWEVHALTWWIARLLDEHREDPEFAVLSRHLSASDGDWRLVQLARQLANLIDRYITFRPEWLRDWGSDAPLPESGDARWQAILYRALREAIGPGHVADRAVAFLASTERSGPARAALEANLARRFPDAVEIFAVSTLPPLYLSVIAGLSRIRDVHLSVLSPSRSYWADLWREVRDGQAQAASDQIELGLFDAPPPSPIAVLLSGLGRLGSDFQACLEDQPELQEGDTDLFESPVAGARPSLLARLQARLLDLDLDFEAGADAGAAGIEVARDDESLRVHLCHGPRRELEVVEGLLREAFERDATLRPEDVIVMAPDIDAIAPDIEAVFGASEHEGATIPFRIADRGSFRRSPVAEAFRVLLGLLGGRGARSEVLDWLALEPARARFELSEEGVVQLADWAERAGIRFGFDGAHREALGFSADPRHTWQGGIDRLVLAHAVGPSEELFRTQATETPLSPEPLGALAGADLLGAIGEVQSLLSRAREAVGMPRNLASWCVWLRGLLEQSLIKTDDNAHEHAAIREVLLRLEKDAGAAGFRLAVPFDAVRERVEDALASASSPQAFLAGGVTFCELVPLRAIPFRVIAILGMSDLAFPRGTPGAGFDLMTRAPRPGDRTTRNDDRYLFLEALISARDQLILTAPARDLRDGSRLPPSVVVTELLDAIEGIFELAPGPQAVDSLRDWVVVEHPLQAHSAAYFEAPGDARLTARSAEAFAAAQARRAAVEAGGGPKRRFLVEAGTGLAEPEAGSVCELDLEDLIDRILQSTRHFARQQLGLRMPRPEGALDDLDPVDLDGLAEYALGTALLEDLCAGRVADQADQRLFAQPVLPVGVRGRLRAQRIRSEATEIAQRVAAKRVGEPLPDLDFSLGLSVTDGARSYEGRLTGRLDQLWPAGRVAFSFGRVGGRRDLDLFIRHLVLCALREDAAASPGLASVAPRSIGVGRPARNAPASEGVVAFSAVAEPTELLARIFGWAVSVCAAPLPFFARASAEFAARWFEGKHDEAWRAAQNSFHGSGDNRFRKSELEQDLESLRVWEGWSPVDRQGAVPLRFRFDELAQAFFEPLRAARETDPR